MNKIIIIYLIVASMGIFSMGTAFGIHIDYNDPDAECKKWVGIVELAKQDYPNFVEETLEMAERKCGFDVSNILQD